MIVIITSGGSAAEADRIGSALVEDRLAACVQIVPVASIYRWRGAVEHAAEHVLHIKTRAELAGGVEARVRALHSYDLPELIVLPVSGGSAEYLAWLRAETEAGTAQSSS